ncbi:MAG: ATP-binding cassette domain-containing protein [Planctomycetota bacterium]|nr:ATP-binding cassette domain-containing protein [Planctomycetota bacterium]
MPNPAHQPNGFAIRVRGLTKVFRVPDRPPGLAGAVRQLFRPKSKSVRAVDELSFEIARGERVAFVGPNGAGKSTTIKVLSGILHPDAGEVEVAGLLPWRDRRELGFRIGTVFGQRTQLWYHLPAGDTFDLLAHVYEQDPAVHARRRAELVEIFGIGDLLTKPVRQLSLGERMRCEIVASLLHAPDVLFLDEPTIGLDVTAKAVIRDLIRDRSQADGSTVLLTSHDTGDMERVCDRVIVIHEGRLLLDQPVRALRQGYIRRKVITLLTAEESPALELDGVEIVAQEPHRTVLEVDLDRTPVDKVVAHALENARLRDLTVEDPPMEEIVQAIYARAANGDGVS